MSIREFSTGALRNSDEGKLDFEGFLSPLVLERYAEYMHKHRIMEDGSLRDSDDWQKGMPLPVYMKSGWRHFREWWLGHRGHHSIPLEEAICSLIFNAMGYLHVLLVNRQYMAKTVSAENVAANDAELAEKVTLIPCPRCHGTQEWNQVSDPGNICMDCIAEREYNAIPVPVQNESMYSQLLKKLGIDKTQVQP